MRMPAILAQSLIFFGAFTSIILMIEVVELIDAQTAVLYLEIIIVSILVLQIIRVWVEGSWREAEDHAASDIAEMIEMNE